ncbi:MAG: flavodoxin domain-containing protein [Oscillospiraceae bacterium]|nr:flavodoxin domain-containing protein [Oscillospiraceae bacterium]
MKTLIFYATKHGATREAAERIAKRISGATLHELKRSDIPALTEFDCVILGSSIYIGSIRKEAKTFLAQNSEVLKNKKFGLFLCGLQADEEKQLFASNFPSDILAAAKATSFLGGIFDPKKAGFMERLIMKIVAKQSVYNDKIDNVQIERFVEEMKS